MTDLVERLRARAFRLATRDMNGDGAALAKEAADELERLSAERHAAIAERDEKRKDADWYRKRCQMRVDERDDARAVADKLAEALRPIAWWSSNGDYERYATLQDARAALAEYDAAKDASK